MIVYISIFLAACSHAVFSAIAHGKFYIGNMFGFFGSSQWVRKYKRPRTDETPKNFYYKTFRIPYKECFPLSATALVFVTDAYHFFQWLTTKLIFLAITRDPLTYVLIWVVWSIGFNIVYTLLSANAKK